MNFTILDTSELTLAQIKEQLQGLTTKSILLYELFSEDADGNQYTVKEINTHGYTAVYAETEQQAAFDQETIVNKHTPKTTTPKTPEEPTAPVKPTVPSIPTSPESPAVSVTPQTQQTTVTLEAPTTPDTGDQTNTAGALHALVVSMMLAGCAVVLRRKYSD